MPDANGGASPELPPPLQLTINYQRATGEIQLSGPEDPLTMLLIYQVGFVPLMRRITDAGDRRVLPAGAMPLPFPRR